MELWKNVWWNRSIRLKGLLAIAVPMVACLLPLAFVQSTALREYEAVAEVERTLRSQNTLEYLDGLIYRATVAVLLSEPDTSNASSTIANARLEIPALIETLRQDEPDPDQQSRITMLQSQATKVIDELVTLPHATPLDRKAVLADLEGSHDLIEGLYGRQTFLLAERSAIEAKEKQASLLIIQITAIVGFVGTLIGLLLISNGIIARINNLRRNAVRLSREEPLKPTALSRDELGQLEAAMLEASSLLSHRKKRLEELIASLITAQEDERRHIAYELHDGLAQTAAAAHQHLQSFVRRFPQKDPTAEALLKQSAELVQRSVNDARGIIAGLRPTILDDFGLSKALEAEVDRLRKEGFNKVDFDSNMGSGRLSQQLETTFFRIGQEALSNIRKHVGPDRTVHVILNWDSQHIRLTISDTGEGFDTKQVYRQPHEPGEKIGLVSMQERAALVGADFSVSSKPGHGTTINVISNDNAA